MVEVTSMISPDTVTATTSFLWVLLKWGAVLLVLGLVFWYLYNRKQYKFDIKLKVFQNEQFVYYESKAKKKEVDGVPFWYIKGLKELVPIPPAKSTCLSTAGRWVAEGYYDRTAGIIWSKDTLSKEEFIKKLTEIKKTDAKSGTTSIDTQHQPMSTTERSLLSNQVIKAALRKGKDLWAMIMPIVFIVAMVFILALVLIFWKDIAEPIITLSGQNAQISENNMRMQQQNIRLYQMLTGGKGNGTHYVVQELPSDQQYFMPTLPEVAVS